MLEEYGKNAYQLDLPANFDFHDVFHVSLLEKDLSGGQNGDETIKNINASVEETRDKYDVVEDIVDSRICKIDKFYEDSPAGLHYLVHWLNQPESERTWEPVLGVKHLKRLISRFHYHYPEAVSTASTSRAGMNQKTKRPQKIQPTRTQLTRTRKRGRGTWTEKNT